MLQELEYTYELLETSNLRIAELSAINTNLREQNNSNSLKNKITEKQLEIANKQLQSVKTSTAEKVTYFSWGMGAGMIVTLLISIL